MPSNSDYLTWRTMTRVINEAKNPNNFVMKLLFQRSETVPTRHIELSFLDRDRRMAGFVKRDGAAILTQGGSESFTPVMPTHIRTKRPMTPSELLNKRRVGSTIFADAGEMQGAMRSYMAREQKYQTDDVMNTEEWLACMALRGAVSYTSLDDASFSITFPRAANQDFSIVGSGTEWNLAGADPEALMLQVMALINDAVSLNVTDVILGTEAATAFMKIQAVVKTQLDLRRLDTGTITYNTQFQEDGAMFLGAPFHGIRVWRYGRKVTMPDGSVQDLIRPKYAEFVCATPAADNVVYYGAIEDFDAAPPGSLLQSKRFMKTWMEKDPSAMMMLLESNPLVIPRRPNSTCSVQVVA